MLCCELKSINKLKKVKMREVVKREKQAFAA